MKSFETFDQLTEFPRSKSGLRMSHIYKPAMLLAVIRGGGQATKEEIAREFVLRDSGQIEFYKR